MRLCQGFLRHGIRQGGSGILMQSSPKRPKQAFPCDPNRTLTVEQAASRPWVSKPTLSIYLTCTPRLAATEADLKENGTWTTLYLPVQRGFHYRRAAALDHNTYSPGVAP